MASMPEPEIISPGTEPASTPSGDFSASILSDEHLDLLAKVLDEWFRIPGTSIRFGLDAIVGLFPVVGDFIASIFSLIILVAAWQRRVPHIIMLRMLFNIAVDTFGDMIPVLGDSFWVLWKPNRMNYKLLVRATRGPRGQQTWRDWTFFVVLFLLALAIIVVPMVLASLIALWIYHRLLG